MLDLQLTNYHPSVNAHMMDSQLTNHHPSLNNLYFPGSFDPTKKGFSKEAMMKCMFGVFMYLSFDERTQVNGLTGMGDLSHFSVKHQMFWTIDDAKKQAAMFNVSNSLPNPFESGILPVLKHACGEQGPATLLAVKRFAGVTPEMNLRECTSYTPLPSANKAVHSGFETQRRHHQKSKTGVSLAP